MRVSELQADHSSLHLQQCGCGQGCVKPEHEKMRVTFSFAPSKISPSTVRDMLRLKNKPNGADAVILSGNLVNELVTEWDLQEDPPARDDDEDEEDYQARMDEWEAAGPHIVQLKPARVNRLPTIFLSNIVGIVFDSLGEKTGTTPSPSLRAQSVRGRKTRKAR